MNATAADWLVDCHPSSSNFVAEVQSGLRDSPRRLPSKYFYDDRGSQLFDAICELDEYYVTRTELAIMRRSADEMADCLGPRAMLIELGSGSSVKTRLLLDHLCEPAAYVPVDISRGHLQRSAAKLARSYPQLQVLPVCADFAQAFTLPALAARRKAIYFPGSTIGNFEASEASGILARMAQLAGRDGALLIGIDLVKDIAVLEAAYDDGQGVTAKFNLNLLRHINRELGANFNLAEFRHEARFDRGASRIEMRLISLRPQTFVVAGEAFELAAGEPIITEYSHKYTIDGFARLAAASGWRLARSWTDPRNYFAVLYLTTHATPPSRPR